MAGGISQTEYWNGAVGERWARHQAVLDALFAPLTAALLEEAALGPGARIIDVGCGAGETTLRAARAAGPAGRALGVDVSEPLLAVARGRPVPEGSAPVTWLLGDAQTHGFEPGYFDAALSRFGVMFFADSRAAFANLRAALVPGGRLTFLCWQGLAENPWVSVPREAVLPLVPDPGPPPGPDTPGPFRFADPQGIRDLLSDAGFGTVACTPVRRPLALGRSDDGSDAGAARAAARTACELGPVSHLLREADPELREAALAAVANRLIAHAEGGTIRLDAACWLVSAA